MRMMKSKKGFTMVELIVVIAVLAILAAVAVPIAGSLLSDANTSSDSSNLALLQDAVEKYVAQNHPYPTAAAGVITAVQANTTLGLSGGVLNLRPRNGVVTNVFRWGIDAAIPATYRKVSVGAVAAVGDTEFVAISLPQQ